MLVRRSVCTPGRVSFLNEQVKQWKYEHFLCHDHTYDRRRVSIHREMIIPKIFHDAAIQAESLAQFIISSPLPIFTLTTAPTFTACAVWRLTGDVDIEGTGGAVSMAISSYVVDSCHSRIGDLIAGISRDSRSARVVGRFHLIGCKWRK